MFSSASYIVNAQEIVGSVIKLGLIKVFFKTLLGSRQIYALSRSQRISVVA